MEKNTAVNKKTDNSEFWDNLFGRVGKILLLLAAAFICYELLKLFVYLADQYEPIPEIRNKMWGPYPGAPAYRVCLHYLLRFVFIVAIPLFYILFAASSVSAIVSTAGLAIWLPISVICAIFRCARKMMKGNKSRGSLESGNAAGLREAGVSAD